MNTWGTVVSWWGSSWGMSAPTLGLAMTIAIAPTGHASAQRPWPMQLVAVDDRGLTRDHGEHVPSGQTSTHAPQPCTASRRYGGAGRAARRSAVCRAQPPQARRPPCDASAPNVADDHRKQDQGNATYASVESMCSFVTKAGSRPVRHFRRLSAANCAPTGRAPSTPYRRDAVHWLRRVRRTSALRGTCSP